MNLREQAAVDARTIIADASTGFAAPISLSSPAGQTVVMSGLPTDIGHSIDMDTGALVAGRSGSVALSLRDLAAACIGVPTGIADSASKPWLVELKNVLGVSGVFKISSVMPDAELGVLVCTLEAYRR